LVNPSAAMHHLRTADFIRFSEALEILHADVEPATLFDRLSEATGRAIASETACFDGFSPEGRIGHLGSFPEDTFSPVTFPILQQFLPQHPLFAEIFERRRREPLRTSDFCRMPQFFRSALYNEFYRPTSLTHQLIVGLDVPGHGLITAALNRRRRDFAEPERLLLGLLVPHFRAAVRHARTVAALRRPAANKPTTLVPDPNLTRRELTVLDLLGQGLSDKEISQRCGISPRTVQNHLQNIYAKLGVTGRTAAVSWSLRLPA
jgi:DNA-binding CsgD family transcriptional regulator